MTFHGLRVIDFHSHFPTSNRSRMTRWRQRLTERYGEEGVRILLEQSTRYRDAWRKIWGFAPPEAEAHTDEEQAARWAADLEEKGVERANYVTGGGNDSLARVVGMYPDRFSGFAHHDIFSEGAAAELERAVEELGLRGFKVIASSQTEPIDGRPLYPVWETVEKLGIPVVIHFGVLGGGGGPPTDPRNMNPLTLWEVAKVFPRIPFVVPHFGSGYLRELLLLCWSCPNVHVDTSGSNQWMRWMPFDLDLRGLFRKMMETVGPDRVIFGTDSSYFPRGFSLPYLRVQVNTCRSIGLEEKSIEKIFYRNAARLLKLDTEK
ncbi:MAG: amidohydrolase family protein [Candidatus Bathyarchaeota archaeon]|nr:amidohydrolase family protein [Candidatus Bathyarchaeota archaeon]